MQRTQAVEQEARVVRAVQESGDYVFVELEGERFVCTSKSGKAYLVTGRYCTCPDYQHRCAGNDLRCKHQIALGQKLLAEGRR